MRKVNLIFAFVLVALTGMAQSADRDVRIQYNDGVVSITPAAIEGVEFKTTGAHVKAIVNDGVLVDKHGMFRFTLSGESRDGSFTLKSKDSCEVVLNGLDLTSRQGAPLWLKTRKGAKLSVEGKQNILTLVAVTDTANQKSAVLFANDNLSISGKGRLVLTANADGCKGINVQKNLTIADLKLSIATTGDNLGPDTTRTMGPPPGFDGQMPEFDPEKMPEDMKKFFEQMKDRMKDGGGFPMGGFPGGFGGGMPQGGFGGFPMGGFPGGEMPEGGFPMGKQKFKGTCKGIKVGGQLTIESGVINVTTESRGAEGIEGKKGIIINGGDINVKAMDDAINSSGKIIFNGGNVSAWSVGNDAIDSNNGEPGSIVIAGGHVCGYSQVGSPEEAFDNDFAPVIITGGTAFGVGGSMGGMTPKPSEETTKQPTLIIYNLSVTEGDRVELFNAKNKKKVLEVVAESLPFTMNGSHTLFTSPELKMGEKYILKVGKTTKKFKIEKTVQTIGEENNGFGGFGGFPMGGFPMGGFGGGFGGGFPGGGMPF